MFPSINSCSVFLLDRMNHELVAKVFDGGVVNDDEVNPSVSQTVQSQHFELEASGSSVC